MFRDNDKINTEETTFFIIASTIEVGTLTVSGNLAKEVGPDAWLAFLIGNLFTLIAIFIIVKLAQRFYKHGFAEFSRIIAGPVIGWILSAVLVVYWIAVSARVMRASTDLVRTTLLDRTPIWVIAFSIMLIAVYLCWNGLEPLCRVSLTTVVVILPLITLITLSLLSEVKIDNFLPFLAEGPQKVLKSAIMQLGDIEEMTFMLFLVPFMKKPEKAMKAALFGLYIPVFLAFFSIVTQIGILGVELTKIYLSPGVAVLEELQLPGAFVERLGVAYSGLWIILVFPTICGLLYAIVLTLSQMFGTKSHRPFIIPVVILTYIISIIPGNTLEFEKFFMFLEPYGLIVSFVIPLLLYITAVIRGVKDE